ncbi:hypothetical protein TWF281_003796 [Arthrobotrys megalospora]
MFSVARSLNDGLKQGRTKILVGSLKPPSDLLEDIPLIEGVRTVSSYNWLSEDEVDSDVPTIQVPGAPPLVSFPQDTPSMKLQPDTGSHFIDQNAARMSGASGMIPGLAACHAYKKDFKIIDYDIVTDRNNLIKLFELMEIVETKAGMAPAISTPWRAPSIEAAASRRGRGNHKPVHPFFQRVPGMGRGGGIRSMDQRREIVRIDADLVSGYDNNTGKYVYDEASGPKTLVLTRWEPQNQETVMSSVDFRGFGGTFLTKTRRFLSLEDGIIQERGPRDVTSFHCLVEYKLLGMKFLVRYHADACDMTRAEFIKWISQDGLRDLSEADGDSESASEDAYGSEVGSEDTTLSGPPDTDTFDLLDAFKTLNLKTDDTNPMSKKPVPSLKKTAPEVNTHKFCTLAQIPMSIIHTPNTLFPSNKILQVKTRGQHTGLNREALYRQLFFSQTQRVFVAYHTKGVFSEASVLKEDISTGLVNWGNSNKEILRKLVTILREVQEKVDEAGGKAALMFGSKKKNNEDSVILEVHTRDD